MLESGLGDGVIGLKNLNRIKAAQDAQAYADFIAANGLPEKLVVYRCSSCEEGRACGFNGDMLDWSVDECHHPLPLALAERIVLRYNLLNRLTE